MEFVRNCCASFRRSVNRDRKQEGFLFRHVVRAIDRKLPLAAEIPFKPGLGMAGDEGNEQRTMTDLITDQMIPGVPAAQLTLIEPNFDAGGAQRLANPSSRLPVLLGVA